MAYYKIVKSVNTHLIEFYEPSEDEDFTPHYTVFNPKGNRCGTFPSVESAETFLLTEKTSDHPYFTYQP